MIPLRTDGSFQSFSEMSPEQRAALSHEESFAVAEAMKVRGEVRQASALGVLSAPGIGSEAARRLGEEIRAQEGIW